MKQKRTGEYVGSIFANVIALVAVSTVPLWRHWTQGVITETWADVLWAVDLSLLVQIAGNLLLLFYRPGWLQALLGAVFSAAGLLSLIVFFIVFPLDFSLLVGQWLNVLIKWVLILGMLGALVGGIVQLVRFVLGGGRPDSRAGAR
jgi:hypothetical protein